MLEIIAQNIEDALAIQEGGADRIELVSHLELGGLTPSLKCVEDVVKGVAIPVNVMVRLSDDSFVLTDWQVGEMCNLINQIGALGANGIVIGPITADGNINLSQLEKLAACAEGMEITFHRAFENIIMPFQAVEALKAFPAIKSILTNGGGKTPLDHCAYLGELAQKMKPIRLLIGGGIDLESFEAIVGQFSNSDYHIGTGVRRLKSPFEAVEASQVAKYVEIMNKINMR